jgi:hypothetical protein
MVRDLKTSSEFNIHMEIFPFLLEKKGKRERKHLNSFTKQGVKFPVA